jgi:hypothetical protein
MMQSENLGHWKYVPHRAADQAILDKGNVKGSAIGFGYHGKLLMFRVECGRGIFWLT